LRKRQIGVSSTEIRGDVTGAFLVPYQSARIPGVIVLGGSEGGVPRDRAALIASHGYAALALAYFAADTLPDELERVPLETVNRAVEWLRKQPMVDPNRIAIVGVSKGAELALLSASRNPRIKAVVAIAPSSVVFQNLGSSRRPTSSWTSGGNDVPFAPFVRSETSDKTRRLADMYNASLDAASPEARIPVERISGPILLLTGKDDALWPSTKMANEMALRLTRHRFRYPVKHLSFDEVGHHVATLPMRPTSDSVRLGGKPQALAKAHIQAWREIVSFLDANTH
jgi:dienelactone hydrolase